MVDGTSFTGSTKWLCDVLPAEHHKDTETEQIQQQHGSH